MSKKKKHKTEKKKKPAQQKTTILDLNSEIILAQKEKRFKESPEEIRKLSEDISRLDYMNQRIQRERKKLKREQISRGTTKERVREIDKMLKGIEPLKVEYDDRIQKKHALRRVDKLYLTKIDTGVLKNELNMISGKDFFAQVSTGITKAERVRFSTLVKQAKQGKPLQERYLERMLKDIEVERKKLNLWLKTKSKTAPARKVRAHKNMLKGLDKLQQITEYNLKAAKEGVSTIREFNRGARSGEYPILIKFIGSEIRINA